ncbi:MAG: DUF481 domain-containing protein [Spongiibacteraceae bacterium]
MKKFLTLLAIPSLLAAGSSQLLAAENTTEPKKIWTGSLELGYTNTSGNTEETNTVARAGLDREKDQWRYAIDFDAINSESDGERSAEKYFLSNRLAYAYTENNYAFGYAAYDKDRFSGYDYQATLAAGYGRRILNNDTMHWDLEVGPGYRISKAEDEATGEDSEELIIRLFTEYAWHFSDNADFTQSLNVESGSDSTITKSITALKLQVIGSVAVKLSYTIKYSDNVPTDKRHADTETAVTLAYSF